MGSNEPQQSYSQLMATSMSNSGHFDTPGLLEFLEQYCTLPEDAHRSLEIICGPYFPGSLLQLGPQSYGIQDPDLFLSVCFILVKQTNLNALVTWVNIHRGQDTASLHFSEDKNTIDVSISRQIGYTASIITSRLKDAGICFEPTRRLWSYGPLTQELPLQLDRPWYFPVTGQNSSTTNLDALKDFDRATTPPLPHLSDTSGSDQHYPQQSGSAVSAESSLQRTSSTNTIRDFFDQQVGSVSDGHLSASHSLVSSGEQQSGSASDAQPSPQPLSAAQTLLDLSEQGASGGQHTPSLSSAAHTLLGLSDKPAGSASDEHRSPLPLSAAPTLTAGGFGEQQSGPASDSHRSLSSATLTTGSFCGSVSDGQRSPLSAASSLVSVTSGLSRHGSTVA